VRRSWRPAVGLVLMARPEVANGLTARNSPLLSE
jgi:hypothetical protein